MTDGREAGVLVNELRIDVEAIRAGVETLASRPETVSIDKELIALKGLADAACETVETLAAAVDGT